jgi:hypothetical protein
MSKRAGYQIGEETMLRKLFVCGVVAVVVGAAPAGAASKRLVGLITAVGDSSLQIKTKTEPTEIVKIDERTDYVKWITHQPWQQDNSASSRSVEVGRCVDVGVRSDNPGVARIVRVSAEGAGTLFDPCKTFRR